MQSVDLLITDIDWLITIDAERRIIRDAAIAVDKGKIVAIDKSGEIAKRFAGSTQIDGRRTVIASTNPALCSRCWTPGSVKR